MWGLGDPITLGLIKNKPSVWACQPKPACRGFLFFDLLN
jgi:hypothetical protein